MGGSLGGQAETWGVAVFVWWAKHIHVVEGCLVTLYSTWHIEQNGFFIKMFHIDLSLSPTFAISRGNSLS